MTDEQRERRRAAYRRFIERNPGYNRTYLREWRKRNRELLEARPRRAKRSHGIEYGPLPYEITHQNNITKNKE